MNIGEYIKNLRSEAGLSQRELAEKSGVSNAEISRLETGDRKKPSPLVLNSLAPYLKVSYEELMQKAGYIKETIDHEGFTESIYRDENGELIDIVRRAKDMYERDKNWANLAYRASTDLTETELNLLKAQTKSLLEEFLKNRKK